MDNIIKELETAYKQVSNVPNLSERELRLEILNKIEKFILEYDWGTSKNIREFIRYCKLPTKDIARLTKQSENNVRLIQKRFSDKARELIGYNKVNIAVNGSQEELTRLVRCIKILEKGVRAENYIPTHILNSVSQSRCSIDYLISDLSLEMQFIKKHSKQNINEEIKGLNKDKVSYIFKVLNSNEGCLIDKKERLIHYILKKEED